MWNLGVKCFVFSAVVLAGDFCIPPSEGFNSVQVENLSDQDLEIFLPQGYRETSLSPRSADEGETISNVFPPNVCLRADFRMVTASDEVVAERDVLCPGDLWQVAVDNTGGYTDSVDSYFDSMFRRRPPIDDVDGEIEPEDPFVEPGVSNIPDDDER